MLQHAARDCVTLPQLRGRLRAIVSLFCKLTERRGRLFLGSARLQKAARDCFEVGVQKVGRDRDVLTFRFSTKGTSYSFMSRSDSTTKTYPT